MWVVMGEKEEV